MLKIIKIFTLIFLSSTAALHAAMHTQELYKLQKIQQETKQSQTSEQLSKKPAIISFMDKINKKIDDRSEGIQRKILEDNVKKAAEKLTNAKTETDRKRAQEELDAAQKKDVENIERLKEKAIKPFEEAVKRAEKTLSKAKTEQDREKAQKQLEEAQKREALARENPEKLPESKEGTAYERHEVKKNLKRDEQSKRAADIEERKNEIKDFEKEIASNEKMLKSAKTDAERKEAKERLADLQELVAQTKKERDDLLKKQTFAEKIVRASTSHDKLLYGGTIAAMGVGAVGVVGAIGGSLALKSNATDQLAQQQTGESSSSQQTDEEGRVEVTIE